MMFDPPASVSEEEGVSLGRISGDSNPPSSSISISFSVLNDVFEIVIGNLACISIFLALVMPLVIQSVVCRFTAVNMFNSVSLAQNKLFITSIELLNCLSVQTLLHVI